MANKFMKQCSGSSVIRETQIQTTMRNHYIPIRMTAVKKTDNNEF